MHELSIATQMIETVLAVAAEHRATRIEKVIVEIGVMRLVVPEILETAFDLAAKGTMAEGARLEAREVPLQVKCRQCGRSYQAEFDNFLCPGCGKADIDIVSGNEIVLKSVVCQVAEGASQP